MQTSTTRELDQLAKLYGTSLSPAEVLSAAAMADRLLREDGLRWCDVLALPSAHARLLTGLAAGAPRVGSRCDIG
jgi:hypothetical protein